MIGKIADIPIGREARIPITEVERLLGEQRGFDHRSLRSGEFARAQRRRAAACAPVGTVGIGGADGTEDDELDGTWLWSDYRAHRLATTACARTGLSGGRVVVTCSDRLTRFGLSYLQALFSGYGVTLTVLHPDDDKTPEQVLFD